MEALFFLFIWIFLYFYNKKYRKEMLIVSFFFFPFGITSLYFHFEDWLLISTLSNTKIGIEGIISTFSFLGVAAVFYKALSNKKFEEKKILINLKTSLSIVLPTFGFIFYFFKLNSSYLILIALLIGILYMLLLRTDLLKLSIASGISYFFLGFSTLISSSILFPGSLDLVWRDVPFLFGRVFGIPVVDLLWFFLAGMYFGVIYQFWTNAKEIKKEKN
jgi:hypothetical protein